MCITFIIHSSIDTLPKGTGGTRACWIGKQHNIIHTPVTEVGSNGESCGCGQCVQPFTWWQSVLSPLKKMCRRYLVIIDSKLSPKLQFEATLAMGLLPDTQNCGLRMRRECQERFPRHGRLAIPACITARTWRTCRDACRGRLNGGFLWSRWRGKRTRHSRRNPQFCVSGERHIVVYLPTR